MTEPASMSTVAQVIQLAVAPVFLLTGVAGILSVLSMRLHRIVDRARLIDRTIPQTPSGSEQELLYDEAGYLWRRIRLIIWAIRLSVASALTVCLVVVSLFLSDLGVLGMGGIVATLFVAAMFLIIGALVLLIFEVSISTRKMRQGLEHLLTYCP